MAGPQLCGLCCLNFKCENFKMEQKATQFYNIFKGMENAHGVYNPTHKNEKGKLIGAAGVIHEPPTVTTWLKHLLGESGLGIGPLDNESMCGWGAIDIDIYNLKHDELLAKIREKKLPLLCAKTKSGGAHLYCFFNERIDAATVKNKMTEMAVLLGYAFMPDGKPVEVFPKQTKVLTERGDTSNWLNMPYMGAYNEDGTLTGTETRYFFNPATGSPWSADEFLQYVDSYKINKLELENIQVEQVLNDPYLIDAPVCIQQILASGPIEEGGRNMMLYNLAVLANKIAGDNSALRNSLIEDFNRKYCAPALSANEVVKIQETIAKHPEYQYQCKEPMLKAYCNVALCKNKKHGLSSAITMPILSDLVKINSDPSVYFMSVNDVRIELSVDDIYDQTRFAKKCIEAINIMPPRLKHEEWRQLVNNLLATRREINAPEEVSRYGKFSELIDDFSRSINPAFDKQDIARDLPWYNIETGELWFRLKSLETFLSVQKLKYERSELYMKIKAMNGKDKQIKIAGKNYNIWCVPMELPNADGYDVEIRTESEII